MTFKGIVNTLDESKNEFLFIPDPNSIEAFYDKELPDISTDVIADLGDLKFVWDRHKSNENIEYHSFSHYLSRHFYNDKYRVVNGQNTREDKVNIGNDMILCGYDLNTDIDDLPADVVFLVKQEISNDKIRLVSCNTTNNPQYLRWYFSAFFTRKKPSILEEMRKGHPISEYALQEQIKSAKDMKKVIQEMIDEAIERSVEANVKFDKLIREKEFRLIKRV